MKKILLILLCLCMAGGCAKKQEDPKPTRKPAGNTASAQRPAKTPGTTPARPTPTPTPLPDFEGILPQDFLVKEAYSETKIMDLMAGSVLDWPSEIIKNSEYGKPYTVHTYTLHWNLADNDDPVYTCTVTIKDSYSDDETRTNCYEGYGYQAYTQGNTALKRDYILPEVGDFFIPSRKYLFWECILDRYSDMSSEKTGKDSIRCDYFWYQETETGPALVYTVSTDGYYVISAQKSHPEIWEEYQVSAKNIHIIPYDEYPHMENALDAYEDWKEANDRESKQEEYCVYGDEEDLYEAYEDIFESLDEATDYWEEYCK